MSETASTGVGSEHTDDASGGNADNIKALRQAAEDGKVARAEAEQFKRELLFAKAGIDTGTKLGKMLLTTWDGELDDVDGLKAEWADLNPAAGDGKPVVPAVAPTPEGFVDPQGQQEHRDNAAGGAPAGAAGTQPDPVDAAFEVFWNNKGRPMEDRQVDALGSFVSAFMQGDPRTRFDPKAWAQKQIIDSAGDLDA
jgi:hypothetical protein